MSAVVVVTPPQSAGSLLDVALEIAERRGKILDQMKQALEKDDVKLALKCARKLCGLPDANH